MSSVNKDDTLGFYLHNMFCIMHRGKYGTTGERDIKMSVFVCMGYRSRTLVKNEFIIMSQIIQILFEHDLL